MKRIINILRMPRLPGSMALAAMMLFGNLSMAQPVINYLPESAWSKMSDKQQHYFDKAMDSHFATEAQLATINTDVFNMNTIVFHYQGIPLTVHRDLRREQSIGISRISWIGNVEGYNGQVHMVYNRSGKTVVGMIEAEHLTFLIRPLGEGLHAIVGWDMTQEEGCMVPDNGFDYRGDNVATPDMTFGNQDVINAQESSGARVTGECNVRVLCPYTDDVDAAVADILSDINNMVNIANTGYMNSEASPGGSISMRIELAAAYEVAYNETGTTINDDLDCITNTSDGCLDDIHTQRSLWDADQVALLTDDGTGLAWVNTAFGSQFSVTGRGNFYAHTFQHELGHNAECTHAINQSTQPGTAPYAGYGEPTTGCFRTVLAYSDACGTGTCGRQNIFSDDDSGQWSCGGNDYTPGTSNNRNQDRLHLSGPILVGHHTVSTDVTYSGDYNWNAREAVHFAAGDNVGYSSVANNFELFSGSEGSFRASESVTLGEGFWARSGSEFTAYTESCATLSRLSSSEEENNYEEQQEEIAEHIDVELFPNPFSDNTTLQFHLSQDAEVFAVLTDATGRTLQTIVPRGLKTAGTHTFNIDGTQLAAGIYYVSFIKQDNNVVKRLVKILR